jgi:DNA-binding transcriptional regulator YdaS (Cro superfamily)
MALTAGARALERWITHGDGTQSEIARALGVSRQAVSSWCCGRVLPSTYYALALEVLTDGEVTVHSWLTEDRMKALEKMTPLRPMATP